MIQGIVGLPGNGKTFMLSKWSRKYLRRGQPVAANFPLRGADYIANFKEFLIWAVDHEDGCLIIDEAGVMLSARNWSSIPHEIQVLFMQHRHHGLDILWGAQRLAQVDKSLRDLSQYITRVDKIWPGIPQNPLPDGSYYLVPIFRVRTYSPDNLKKPEWVELHYYQTEIAELYTTADIVKSDQSSKEDMAAALERWKRKSGKPMRIG